MCGIYGYMAANPSTNVVPVIFEGLMKLEYRGYDAAGMGVMKKHSSGRAELKVRKIVGKIGALKGQFSDPSLMGSMGIGHTRWTTHGSEMVQNAHPHTSNQDACGRIAVVHNGTFDNHRLVREELIKRGYHFDYEVDGVTQRDESGAAITVETDSAILPILIQDEYKKLVRSGSNSPFEMAVVNALQSIDGQYAVVVVHEAHPDTMIVARHGNPIVFGICKDGDIHIASGAEAMPASVSAITHLADSHLVVLKLREPARYVGINGMTAQEHRVEPLQRHDMPEDKGDYPHFMLAEIMSQGEKIQSCIDGLVDPRTGLVHVPGLMRPEIMHAIRRMDSALILGCGTALNAGKMLEGLLADPGICNMPAYAVSSSTYRTSLRASTSNQVVFVVSQSGETADTNLALQKAKVGNKLSIALTNRPMSQIARAVDLNFHSRIGAEIGVASTKAYTAQCAMSILLALNIAQMRQTGDSKARKRLALDLLQAPAAMNETLRRMGRIQKMAHEMKDAKRILVIGRNQGEHLAKEIALKIQEVSYIDAYGFDSGELKHGPLALIEPGTPIVVFLLNDALTHEVLGNVEEVAARGARPIIFSMAPPGTVKNKEWEVIQLPQLSPWLAPLIAGIPGQLLAYHLGIARGTDVDKPRNLAKSVTVT